MRVVLPGDRPAWVATESAHRVSTAMPGLALQAPAPVPACRRAGDVREDALLAIVGGWAECSGPFTSDEFAAILGLEVSNVAYAVGQLELQGLVLRGRFRPSLNGHANFEEFCDRRTLARIHRGHHRRFAP